MISILTVILLSAGIQVHDGDTMARGPDRVRLWGVDAPPLDGAGGTASRDYLRALIAGRPLACEMLYRDRYGRRVARCRLPDGADVGCAMVAAGHARDWPRYSGRAYQGCEKNIR